MPRLSSRPECVVLPTPLAGDDEWDLCAEKLVRGLEPTVAARMARCLPAPPEQVELVADPEGHFQLALMRTTVWILQRDENSHTYPSTVAVESMSAASFGLCG